MLDRVRRIYEGSNGEATKALYAELAAIGGGGHLGAIAINLFRAQKASERAKVYSRGFKGEAYQKKEWSIGNLVDALQVHAADRAVAWGWGLDPKQAYHRDVLYVDLPTGQVSFHCGHRGAGPAYPGAWDGMPRRSPARIVRYVAWVLDPATPLAEDPDDPISRRLDCEAAVIDARVFAPRRAAKTKRAATSPLPAPGDLFLREKV